MEYILYQESFPVYGNNLVEARYNALVEAFYRLYTPLNDQIKSGYNYIGDPDTMKLAENLEMNVKLYTEEGQEDLLGDDIGILIQLEKVYNSVRNVYQDSVKIFKIILDGVKTNTIPITNNTTIKVIKDYFKNYLSGLGKDPLDYNIKIYLDTVNKLDVNNTNEYDDINLNSVWNKITNGHIVLTRGPNYFRRLYKDAIYQIALKLDLNDLTNLCRSDKRMSRICSDDDFWLMRLTNEYGIMVKPDKGETWKSFYIGVRKFSKYYFDMDNYNLFLYGKYLTNLNLDQNRTITDEGLKHVPNLTNLELNENITDEGLKYVSNLTNLYISYNENITDEGLKHVPNLTNLDLAFNRNITDEGLKHVPNLTNLNLISNKNITDEGLKYVPDLTNLNLYNNENITDEGLKHVPNLTYLNLEYNENITDDGLKHVPNLIYLNLGFNYNITDEGLKYVPNVEIVR